VALHMGEVPVKPMVLDDVLRTPSATVLQCVAECYSVLLCVAVYCSVLQCVAACVAVCCSV